MENKNEISELKQFVDGLDVNDPVGHRNLMLVPVGGRGTSCLDYILSSEAFRKKVLTVTEVSEVGEVNELLVKSSSEKMVLMLDGEELVGSKQNRILNTTILLAPKANVKIPVSCVERGRWGFPTRAFHCGSYAPPELRAQKSRSVRDSLS